MLPCPDCDEPLNNAFLPCPKCANKAAAPPSGTDTPVRPEPLAVFAAYAEQAQLDARQAKRRKKFWTIAAVFAVFLLAREGGLFNLYLCGFTANSKTQTHLYGEQRIYRGQLSQSVAEVTYKQLTSNSDNNFRTSGWQSGGDFRMFQGSRFAGDLQDEIQKGLRKEPTVVANLEALEIDGAYWLPLLKTGNCKYRVRLQVVGKDAVVYSGVLDGETELDFMGLCPIRTLKEILGAEIAKRIIESLNSVRH
jgi:hypothetical protein